MSGPGSSARRTTTAAFGAGLALAMLFLAAGTAPASAAQDEQKLEQIEKARQESQAQAEALERKAEAIRNEILALKVEMIASARQTQDTEERLTEIEDRLVALEQEEVQRRQEIRDQHSTLVGTLSALQRLAAQPPEALIARPGSPIDTVRSALLLSIAVPAIEDRADYLRDEIQQIIVLREQIKEERVSLQAASKTLQQRRGQLASLIDRKKDLERSALDEGIAMLDKARKLGAEAEDMRDLLVRLQREAEERAAREAEEEAEREAHRAAVLAAKEQAVRDAVQEAKRSARAKRQSAARSFAARRREELKQTRLSDLPAIKLAKPDNVRSFPDAPNKAALLLPARGKLIAQFGEYIDGEPDASKGLTIETRAASQVIAPFDGRVAYAGPFRRYGLILIIEHGGRYHTLLAGLDQIHAVVGQWVLAGEPVGIMASIPESRPRLYMELRQTGQPINPLPWLAATGNKVQG